jgi:Trypsin
VFNKRKGMLAAVAAGAVISATAGHAAAITNNFVPDFEHPFVGLVVFYDENGEFSHRCSGSLLTPTVFLTAGHCTDGAASARVYFQQDAGAHFDPVTEVDPVSGYPETCAPGTLGVVCATSDELFNYGFDDFETFPDIHDAGLVILDQPIAVPEYGALAAAGSLNGLDRGPVRHAVRFTASGYGLSLSGPQHVVSFRSRLMATSRIVNLQSHLTDGFNLQTIGRGKGSGGTCSGDSGGPIFFGGTASNTIVAVTSFGLNAWCRGVDFSYRTDRTAVLNWIRQTVGATAFAQIRIVSI